MRGKHPQQNSTPCSIDYYILKGCYLQAEDLTRTDRMDINCLTSSCLFCPHGVLLHGCVTGDVLLDAFFFRAFLSRAFLSQAFLLSVLLEVLLSVLLDVGETRRGALSAIWGLVISSLNPKHRFLRFRYRLFHHRCRLLVRFYRSYHVQHSNSSHFK